MLGFTYNGVHSTDMKVYYAPNESDRGEFMSNYEVIDASRSWTPGGDYFGSRVKSKEFTLNCWYEWTSTKERNAIARWLDRRTSGYLIFDERPWARYYVHPTKVVEPKDYSIAQNGLLVHSGTLTITFTAYWPYAELLYTVSDRAPYNIGDEVDLLPSSLLPFGIILYNGKVVSSSILVYNPGTEQGQSLITFAGDVGDLDDLVFTNETTGDTCVLKKGLTTNGLNTIEINSKTMRMEVVSGGAGPRTVDFEYHGGGYISFAPNRIIRDRVSITTAGGSSIIHGNNIFNSEMVGAYIYVDSAWHEILACTASDTIVYDDTAASTQTFTSRIATMNKVAISSGNDSGIITLEIVCKPEVR